MTINKPTLWRISWQLIVSWLLLSTLTLLIGDWLIKPVLPFASSIIEVIQDEYRPSLKISETDSGLIQMQAITRRSIPSIAARGAKLTAGSHVGHTLVPLTLFFALIMVWPVSKMKHRMILLLTAIPLSFSIIAVTLPFQLTGQIEMMLQNYAHQYNVERKQPFLLIWMIFMEAGGRWLLPIAIAATNCILIQKYLEPPIKLKKKQAKKR